ncbi:hypothetical protein AALB39_03205 [Lachnospiraceae bacterium 54-53]
MKHWYLNLWTHLTIILSLFMGTLWVLDQLNPMMNFLNNNITDGLFMLFCISALITSASFLRRRCRDENDSV